MTLAIANLWKAISYVNDSFPEIGVPKALVSFASVRENQPGHVTFRIYRSRTHSHDTLGAAVLRVRRVLGHSYVRTCTEDTETYAWQLTTERSIVLWHKKGVGTFIQLRDDAPATGVDHEH